MTYHFGRGFASEIDSLNPNPNIMRDVSFFKVFFSHSHTHASGTHFTHRTKIEVTHRLDFGTLVREFKFGRVFVCVVVFCLYGFLLHRPHALHGHLAAELQVEVILRKHILLLSQRNQKKR